MKDASCVTCVQLFAKQKEAEERLQEEENPQKRFMIMGVPRRAAIKFRDHVNKCHGDEWENGLDFMKRQNFSEDTMRQTVILQLPVYIFTEAGTLKSANSPPLEEGRFAVFNDQFPPDKILNIIAKEPIKWWFRRKEVGFFERLRQDICTATSEAGLLWITPVQLAQEWGITSDALSKLVQERGLPAWILDRHAGLLHVSPRYVQNCLARALFDRHEARDFHDQYQESYDRLQKSHDWLSPKTLLKRWNKKLPWLEAKAKEMIVPVYSFNPGGEPQVVSGSALFQKTSGFLAGNPFDLYLFKKPEIQAFEEILLDGYEKYKPCLVKETLGMKRLELASCLWHDLAYKWTAHGPLPEHAILDGIERHKWGIHSPRRETIRKALKDISDDLILRKRGNPHTSITYDLT